MISLSFPKKWKFRQCILLARHVHFKQLRLLSNIPEKRQTNEEDLTILSQMYKKDSWTNVTPRVLSKIGENIHNTNSHPINLIKKQITNYFYRNFVNRVGNPIFSVYDNISPVVTTYQNFDSLLVPEDHISRSITDSYYVNEKYMLRAHTSAHQEDLIKMGLDAFLVVGDVYRRDEIDSSHYPVFHQMEGVRLFTEHELLSSFKVSDPSEWKIFDRNSNRTPEKQESHTVDVSKLLELNLKGTLSGLATVLFGKDIEYRWLDCYFPFTHPSWELEIKYMGEWLEVLGCGVIEQQILKTAGADSKVGWAFGLGLDRLAMKLYEIPDIRVFWSKDKRFFQQFHVDDPGTPIKYKHFSRFPTRENDLSFWIPDASKYSSNDFYDLVRNIGGDVIEKVTIIDDFTHPKTGKTSHCYRILYCHMEKALTPLEVNEIHRQISDAAVKEFGVEIR